MPKQFAALTVAANLVAILALACGGAAAPTPTRAPATQPTAAGPTAPTPTSIAGLPGLAPTLPAPTAAPRVAASRGKIVYAVITDIGSTNTITGNISDRWAYTSSFNLGLTDTAHGLKLVPAGAKAWETSADGKVITFTIRDDVVFHDGTRVTVDDWVYRYDLWLHPKEHAVPGKTAPTTPPVPERIERVDSTRFRIVFPSPDPIFVGLGSNSITSWGRGVYPKAYIQRVGFEEFAKKPIGAGPYKLVEYSPGEKVVLEAHEQFFEGPPQVKTVDIRTIPEDTTRVAMLLTGEADISISLPPNLLSRVEDKPGMKINATPNYMTPSLVFQSGAETIPGTDRPNPFRDVRVRRAVAHSIDRKAIVERVAGRAGVTVKGIFGEYVSGYDGDNIVEYEYNPQKARQLLEEANYPFDYPFTLLTYPLSPPMPAAMEAAATYMQAVGMKVQYSLREVSASTSLWRQKQIDPTSAGVYPIQGLRTSAYQDIATYVYTYLGRAGVGSFPTGDSKLEALMDEARLAFEPRAREETQKRLYRYIHEQAYYITLYNMIEITGVGPRVDYNYPPQHAGPSHLNYVTWRPGFP